MQCEVLQQHLRDFSPGVHLVNRLEMCVEYTHFFRIALKQEAVRHHGKVAQNFQSVVHKMRDTEFFADRCLSLTRSAEPNIVLEDTNLLKETIVAKPVERLLLGALAALGDDEHSIAEPYFDETREGIKRARNCGGLEIVV